MKGFSLFAAVAILTGATTVLTGCSSGESGVDNAEGVKALAKSPNETQNNNPDVKVDTDKLKFGADGTKKAGK